MGFCKISHSGAIVVKFTTNDEAMEPNAPDTSNFLNWVEIKNFKSIKDLRLDCKRVNVFIGKPNVGKSNILEALGLLEANYSGNRFLGRFARYRDMRQLFYDNNTSFPVSVASNYISAELVKIPDDEPRNRNPIRVKHGKNVTDKEYKYLNHGTGDKNPRQMSILANDGENIKTDFFIAPEKLIKKYDFGNVIIFDNDFQNFLLPPDGRNLYEIVYRNKELANEFANLFQAQGLDFVFDTDGQTFILQKKIGHLAYQYPYFSIADTFRRFMFYIAAIESNENSVLIFEEPEVHSFPPYTQDVAYRMIYSADNQFFVSTHSPYLLQTLVENLGDDQLSVFVTYYENYETKVKALTPEELSFVQEYSTDVFFNLDRFIPNAHPTSAV